MEKLIFCIDWHENEMKKDWVLCVDRVFLMCCADEWCEKVYRIKKASNETAIRPAHTLLDRVAELGISMTKETVIDSVLIQYVFLSFT